MIPLEINGATSQIPIVQGGMGVGISLSRLAGAVAAQGGVGVISAAVPGYNRENFSTNPLKANLEALAFHITAAKETAKKADAGGLIGVNIMCALNNYADYVKCCEESGADIIISGAGLPTELPSLAQKTRIAPIISSKKAISVLLRLWDKKFSRTADMVVIEGPKAGGHLGFSPEELEKDFEDEVKLILQEVAVHEEKFGRKIPVIFAGGIHTRDDVNRYISLGLSGVQISTRLVATEECDAAEAYKNAYIAAKKEDIVIIKSPVGMPGRALNNAFVQKLEAQTPEPTRCISCLSRCNPKTTSYCISRALIKAAQGDTENGLIFCGANADKVTEISTVKKIFAELL